ncbi:MAG: response regulator receiver protein [Spirosoma sp.]|nr:response regulator receiver protein [Spirosoma sp.]
MTPSRLVFLVDDSADYRFLVKQVFRMFLPQHQVVFFADGADLVDAMDSLAGSVEALPGVLALDVDMPGLNGFQTLAHLKKHPLWESVPVVMMTNRDEGEYRRESNRLGASAFVLKPMDLMSINSMMTQLCEYDGDFRQLTS